MDAETDWKKEAAGALRRLALSEEAKAYVIDHPALYRPLYRAACRFIGGEDLDTCAEEARRLNQRGHAVTIDYMGESTRDRATASNATAEFVRAARVIENEALRASLSLDLSHVGLVIDEDFCFENASAIAEAASEAGLEVMISAEGPERTDAVLGLHERLCARHENVGVTVQAFLHRTPGDVERLVDRPGKIRVVKGAFEAPQAMRRGAALDEAYVHLARELLDEGHPCSVGTHDPAILSEVSELIANRDVQAGRIEFEMLKGIAEERLADLQRQGYRTRVYLPYGKEWQLYFCNRLAEHPPNVFAALADAEGAGET